MKITIEVEKNPTPWAILKAFITATKSIGYECKEHAGCGGCRWTSCRVLDVDGFIVPKCSDWAGCDDCIATETQDREDAK